MNKKAQTTVPLLNLILVSLVFVLILGAFMLFFGEINDAFQGDLSAGQVNLTEASDDTIGKINEAYIDTADLLGIFFLFGLVFAIMINGFLTRNSTPKLFFMIDFIIILFAYILAVYISNAYESILQALPFVDLISTNLGNTSQFVLLLPVITAVVGFLTMILTYAGIPRTKTELEVAGF